MKKSLSLIVCSLFSLSLLCLVFCSGAAASDTWDNIKRKTRDTKNITKLKMNRSKYENKIDENYQDLGKLIYNKIELKEMILKDHSAAGFIKRIDSYNKKIEAIETTIKAIESGEDISTQDIDDIDAGIGLEDDTGTSDNEHESMDMDDKETSESETKIAPEASGEEQATPITDSEIPAAE